MVSSDFLVTGSVQVQVETLLNESAEEGDVKHQMSDWARMNIEVFSFLMLYKFLVLVGFEELTHYNMALVP